MYIAYWNDKISIRNPTGIWVEGDSLRVSGMMIRRDKGKEGAPGQRLAFVVPCINVKQAHELWSLLLAKMDPVEWCGYKGQQSEHHGELVVEISTYSENTKGYYASTLRVDGDRLPSDEALLGRLKELRNFLEVRHDRVKEWQEQITLEAAYEEAAAALEALQAPGVACEYSQIEAAKELLKSACRAAHGYAGHADKDKDAGQAPSGAGRVHGPPQGIRGRDRRDSLTMRQGRCGNLRSQIMPGGRRKKRPCDRYVQVYFSSPPKLLKSFDEIVEASGCDSRSQMICRAVRLFETLITRRNDGAKIILRSPDGSEVEVMLDY